MRESSSDTIAAIATPPGLGGIAVLRVSGPEALVVAHALFTPVKGSDAGFVFRPRHMHYGQARDREGQALDDVLAVYMPGPHSATGEDVAEIHCHGGTGITTALLDAALAAGARLAGPGEFTRRAFLNGRMDLTQAEAVAELVSAPTREGARLAAAKLEGGLAREVSTLRSSLNDLRVQVTLAVDFPDEDAELLPRGPFAHTVRLAIDAIGSLLAAFERARLWREGALAVLAGRVNAGKSSLLNALLGRPRAIVSEEAGTTRDYIEESVNLKGLPLRLVDTAGLREDGGLVEAEGIRRARDLAAEADVLLFVTDARKPPGADEGDFLLRHKEALRQGRLLLVLNKIDALSPEEAGGISARLAAALPDAPTELLRLCPRFFVSTRTGEGLDALTEGIRQAICAPHALHDSAGGRKSQSASMQKGGSRAACRSPAAGDIAPNLRQSQSLRKAGEELNALEAALEAGYPPDILGVHLEAAVDLLDEVTGSTGNEELLDRIFSSFCIGK